MSLLQLMMVAALLVSGLGVALLGSLKVPLAKRLQIDEARVGGLVSIFGFAMIPVILLAGFLTDHLGRQGVFLGGCFLLTASLALPPGRETALIFILALACVGVMLGVVFGRGREWAVAMVAGAGLVFGPIFPTLMAVLLGHFEPALHGRAVGLLFAVGGVGWTLIPMLIGAYARRTTVQRGFTVAAGAAVCLSAVAAALALR